MSRDRVQARPRRPQDDPRFRRARCRASSGCAAAGADRRRHPRGRPGHLEQLEAPAARRPLRARRGAPAARPQAPRPQGAGRGQEGARRRAARLDRGAGHRRARRPLRRRLLDRRARGHHRAQPAALFGREAMPRTSLVDRRAVLPGARRDAGDRLSPTTTRGCSTASPARSTSPAATSSTRASTPPATAWRSTISSSRTRSASRSARTTSWRGSKTRSRTRSPAASSWSPQLAAPAAAARPRRELRGRARSVLSTTRRRTASP